MCINLFFMLSTIVCVWYKQNLDLRERLNMFRRGIKLGFKYRMISYCTWPQFTNLVAVTRVVVVYNVHMHHTVWAAKRVHACIYASFDWQTLTSSSVEFSVYMWVCVCVQHMHQHDKNKRGGSNIKMFPWKSCKLCGALNLFGCCCQANEVSEWGQPGGGRGQPRARAACQAAVLRGCRPGPTAALVRHSPLAWPGTQHIHLPHMNTKSGKSRFSPLYVWAACKKYAYWHVLSNLKTWK